MLVPERKKEKAAEKRERTHNNNGKRRKISLNRGEAKKSLGTKKQKRKDRTTRARNCGREKEVNEEKVYSQANRRWGTRHRIKKDHTGGLDVWGTL